jgi:hypothetical protein
MAERLKLAAPMMSARAGFNANEAGRQGRKNPKTFPRLIRLRITTWSAASTP